MSYLTPVQSPLTVPRGEMLGIVALSEVNKALSAGSRPLQMLKRDRVSWLPNVAGGAVGAWVGTYEKESVAGCCHTVG